jgi:hypothetical protein
MNTKPYIALTVGISLCLFASMPFVEDAWTFLLKMEGLSFQSLLLAIVLYKLSNDDWKVFCGWLILWRLSSVFITYMNFDDNFAETTVQTLSYSGLFLLILSLIHLKLKNIRRKI